MSPTIIMPGIYGFYSTVSRLVSVWRRAKTGCWQLLGPLILGEKKVLLSQDFEGRYYCELSGEKYAH